ncbi:Putative ribonuclease H protein At1g65750 [Linum perenne]
MGFRDLRAFNLAMVFKARYFPNGDFLSAPKGNGPSYAWQSIRATTIVTPEEVSLHGLRVCDLLIPGTYEWDMEMIEGIFEERDVEEILKVPIGLGGVEDRRIWHFDKYGRYTVKSAYRVCMDFFTANADFNVQRQWTHLWSLEIQPKMKNFLWRLARNVMPNRSALRRRHIAVPVECGVCGLAEESNDHLFRNCHYAIDCWEAAGLTNAINPPGMIFANFDEWFASWLQSPHNLVKCSIAAVLWGIWRERNRRVWTEEALAADIVVKLATEEMSEWKQARVVAPNSRMVEQQPCCPKWHAPPVGVVKCNSDFGVFAAESSMGMGMVIRDNQGEVIKYKMWHGRGIWAPREGEAAALMCAMRWLIDEGFREVIFETDAEEVGLAVNLEMSDESEFGCLIAMCREMLISNPGFSVQVVRRNRNMVAHVLARRSISCESPFIGSSPLIGMDNVLSDICFSSNH